MAKESSEGELLKKKSVDHNRKRIENLSKANTVKEKVTHLDQLEFLPIFPYSELLISMRRDDVPSTSIPRHSGTICPLGTFLTMSVSSFII